jgi:LysM repeat protein
VLQVPGQPARDRSSVPAPGQDPGSNGAQDANTAATSGSSTHRPAYPEGEFTINNSRVVFARGGISLLSVADQYELPLARLLEFNDLKEEDVLVKDQLLFLQRKRRTGSVDFHIVLEGESLYDISQAEGIRYDDLLQMNQLKNGDQPAVGEKIYLKTSAPSRPLLEGRDVNNQNTGTSHVHHQGTR